MFIVLGIVAIVILYSVYGDNTAVAGSSNDKANSGYIPPDAINPAINPAELAIEKARLANIAIYAETEGKNFLPGNIVAPIPIIEPIILNTQDIQQKVAGYLASQAYLSSIVADVGYVPPPDNNPVPPTINVVTPEPTTIPDSVYVRNVNYDLGGNTEMRTMEPNPQNPHVNELSY
jgi:hypothetical protein